LNPILAVRQPPNLCVAQKFQRNFENGLALFVGWGPFAAIWEKKGFLSQSAEISLHSTD
jgi:hypothetical protein